MRNDITCPNCGQEVPQDARFCHHCGKEIPVKTMRQKCIYCGAEIPNNSAYCMSCGKPQREACPPSPAPAHPNGEENNQNIPYIDQLERMPVGSSVIKDGRVYKKNLDGTLQYSENGNTYVDASSFFAMNFKNRQQGTGQEQQPGPEQSASGMPQQSGQTWSPAQKIDGQSPDTMREKDNMGWMPQQPKSPYQGSDPISTSPVADQNMNTMPYESDDTTNKSGEKKSKKKRTSSSRQMPKMEDDDEPDDNEFTRFQSTVNVDGYYNDQETLDADTYYDARRKVDIVPLACIIAGIILVAIIIVGLSSML